jgi:hypothetical protein
VKKSCLLFVTLFLSVVLPAAAQTTQIEGVAITNNDVSQLMTALHTALQPNDSTIPLVVSLKPTDQMPSYDEQSHYDGMHDYKPGVKAMYVWLSKDLKGADVRNAIAAAFLLALSDGGYGGQAFKELYDICAAKDAQLPADAPDPFLNRHKLAAMLVQMVQSR